MVRPHMVNQLLTDASNNKLQDIVKHLSNIDILLNVDSMSHNRPMNLLASLSDAKILTSWLPSQVTTDCLSPVPPSKIEKALVDVVLQRLKDIMSSRLHSAAFLPEVNEGKFSDIPCRCNRRHQWHGTRTDTRSSDDSFLITLKISSDLISL